MKQGFSLTIAVSIALIFAPQVTLAQDEPVRAVRLIAPHEQQDRLQRTFFGQIAARETVDLSFQVSGEIVRFPATEGQRVPKDALLAQLDLAPYERAVERARISLTQAERDLQRASTLAESNVASTSRAEDAQTARDLADVALREAQEALEDATLTAPFDGLIAERLTAAFTTVAAGTPIVRLHDMSQLRVEIDVPERLFQQIGDPTTVDFTVSLPALPDPVPLTLVEYQAQTEAIGQSYLVVLALPDQPFPTLIPGASATVTASIAAPAARTIVPAAALVADENRAPFVMAFEPTGADRGTVRPLPVEVSSRTGTELEVTGLPEDIEIVGAGAHLLREGQTVRRFTGLTVEE